jgi:hypothetical protein
VRSSAPETKVVQMLRSKEAERWQLAVAAGQETNPVEYLYLDELAILFARSALAVRERGWTESLGSCLKRICKFRNSVFHANQPLLTAKRTAADIATLAEVGNELVTALGKIAKTSNVPTA